MHSLVPPIEYVPAAHDEQDPDTAFQNSPEGHVVHEADPAKE